MGYAVPASVGDKLGASVQDDHGLMQLAKTVFLSLIFLAMSLCSAAVYAESGAGRMFAVYFES